MKNNQPSAATVSAVMRTLAKASVAKRHAGKTEEQISEYYSNLRRGKKARKRA
jgi:hypothetical protein